MKHKYNIEHLLQSIIGYKGLPYPGAIYIMTGVADSA